MGTTASCEGMRRFVVYATETFLHAPVERFIRCSHFCGRRVVGSVGLGSAESGDSSEAGVLT